MSNSLWLGVLCLGACVAESRLLGLTQMADRATHLVEIKIGSSATISSVAIVSKVDATFMSEFGSTVDREQNIYYCALTPDLHTTQYFAIDLQNGHVLRQSNLGSNPGISMSLQFDNRSNTMYAANSLDTTSIFTVDTDSLIHTHYLDLPPGDPFISHGYALDCDRGIYYVLLLNRFNFTGDCNLYGLNLSSKKVVSHTLVDCTATNPNVTVGFFYDPSTKAFVSLTMNRAGPFYFLSHFDPVTASHKPVGTGGRNTHLSGVNQVHAMGFGIADRLLTCVFDNATLVQFDLDHGTVVTNVPFPGGEHVVDIVDS